MSAKQNAQKVYKEVLKKEGLTEDDISKTVQEKRPRIRRFSSTLSRSSGDFGLDHMKSFRSKSGLHSETMSIAEELESLGRDPDVFNPFNNL